MTQTAPGSEGNRSAEPTEVERLTQEINRTHDMYLRTLADFDNYRKRMQREQDSAVHTGKRQLVLALLEVMDDFERALAYASTASDAMLAGMRLIQQRLTGLLHAQGVVPYTSIGQPFDAALHEAVEVIHTAPAQSGVVIDELRHGYRWGDAVLRPAHVRVAQ